MDTRSSKNALVWGSILIIMGGLLLVQSFVDLSPWIWVAGLVVMGVITFVIYTTDTSQWWILIPTFALWAIAGLVALITVDILRDELIATYVLTVIALPFLYVFIRDRAQWWALIPAYILFAIGLMVGLIGENVLQDLLIPAYVLLTIALPFFVVYIRDTKQWWALIPGGIIGIIGISFLLAEGAFKFFLPVAVILVGAWILLRQFTQPRSAVIEAASTTPSDIEEVDT
jgi:hypothetical protein